MNTDMSEIPEESDVVVGGGPAEGEELNQSPNPNPDAVHPDYKQTIPGAAAPSPATESGSPAESGSDES
jgi:hypothetical protein